jgi:hypothetical protein
LQIGSDTRAISQNRGSVLFLVAQMPKYLFRLNNGSPEDHTRKKRRAPRNAAAAARPSRKALFKNAWAAALVPWPAALLAS